MQAIPFSRGVSFLAINSTQVNFCVIVAGIVDSMYVRE